MHACDQMNIAIFEMKVKQESNYKLKHKKKFKKIGKKNMYIYIEVV